eukprot:c24666_g1_i1 orf=291-2867(+)
MATILQAAHPSFLLLLAITILLSNLCVQADTYAPSDVYVVLMNGSPVVHYDGSLPAFAVAPRKPDGRADMSSEAAQRYASFLVDRHDTLLNQALGEGAHLKKKLYSYHYLLNGFAAWLTSEEAEILRHASPEIISVEKDGRLQKFTTYTPKYMGLPCGAWADNGGVEYAGEGIVIGLVDTGVNPFHPSFSDSWGSHPYSYPAHFTGSCEVTKDFPAGSCNRKLVGARHFAMALMASGHFNTSEDSASPLDGDGHGTHTASTAAGNSGVPVVIDGMDFGLASGMAPRAHIAIYKSMFRNVGGYFSDTVAAMDQAVQDGVDILSLSIGPEEPPRGVATYFSIMEMAALSAVKAGVFVVQAAGNSGPLPGSVASFSPWIFTVGAAYHNRSYHNTILLDNQLSLKGFGLSPGTESTSFYQLVLASDAAKKQAEGSFRAYDAIINACQDPKVMDEEKVQGRILICKYTIDFSNGKASMHSLVSMAKKLHARGVIVVVDRFTAGYSDMGPFPSSLPLVLIASLQESLMLLAYYNNNTITRARIMGGLNATFSKRAPQVAFYSSRGPDVANDRRAVAEVMKPNAMAPGDMIWAAWSPFGNDDDDFSGANFALASGTSMAAPHVAGIAALVKQKNPNMSPAAMASALTTTASTLDHHGSPLLAQRPSYNLSMPLGPASPFDFGGGEVNPTAAIDPGLIFDAGFGDYVNFLCAVQGGGQAEVLKTTGLSCRGGAAGVNELNQPSVTVANLTEPRSFRRRATSVARHDETYTVSVEEPEGVSVSVTPRSFLLKRGSVNCRRRQGNSRCRLYTKSLRTRNETESAELVITLTPTSASSRASFGSILLSGSHGHNAHLPISVVSRSLLGY